MIALLEALPVPKSLLMFALVVLLGVSGVQAYRLAAEQREHAETKTAHAEELAERERAARLAVEQARTEERRRTEALQGVVNDAEKNIARARSDADAASDAGERLRQYADQLAAACGGGSSDSNPAKPGAAAESTADLLADMRRRIDKATDGIARYADEARTAGEACQRSYDALMK